MSRHIAVFVAVLAVIGGVGVVAGAATAQEDPGNATAGNETASGEDVPDEVPSDYVAEIDDGVYIVDYHFRENDVVVTFAVTAEATPVEVQYADIGGEVEGESGVRVPPVQTQVLNRPGEHKLELPAGDGPAGQMTSLSVDGRTVVIEGEGGLDRSLVAYLSANQALLVGAAIALAGATIAGYRQKLEDDLDEPENAFRGGNR